MSSMQIRKILAYVGTVTAIAAAPVYAQGYQVSSGDLARRNAADSTDDSDGANAHAAYTFKSRKDSIAWAKNRAIADRASGFRLVVSLQDRHLWAVIGRDTVLSAPVAVAKGTTLEFGKQEWKFDTPRGVRTVLGKEADPIWQPPEWLYAETALEYGLKLGHLTNGRPIKLSDGRLLTVRDGVAGVIEKGKFAELPVDEHIVFDNTLFVPPMGSKNRKVEGELGKYRLILGEGYLLHGTPYKESIGLAATHGCVRMRDEDIEWLYDHVPVGTKVYIY
jgi:lipoprotein-anchoring transpeptidase ErfK/SrfK